MPPEHGGCLKEGDGVAPEPMDAVHDQIFEAGRNVVEAAEQAFAEAGIPGLLALRALLREIARELLGKERVAFRLGDPEL